MALASSRTVGTSYNHTLELGKLFIWLTKEVHDQRAIKQVVSAAKPHHPTRVAGTSYHTSLVLRVGVAEFWRTKNNNTVRTRQRTVTGLKQQQCVCVGGGLLVLCRQVSVHMQVGACGWLHSAV